MLCWLAKREGSVRFRSLGLRHAAGDADGFRLETEKPQQRIAEQQKHDEDAVGDRQLAQQHLRGLFAFDFAKYETGLAHLSKTIELFQSRRWFSGENSTAANPFPPELEKLCSLDFHYKNIKSRFKKLGL